MFGSLGSIFSSSNSKKRRRSSRDWDSVRHGYDDTRDLDEINSEWEEEYGSDQDDDGREYGLEYGSSSALDRGRGYRSTKRSRQLSPPRSASSYEYDPMDTVDDQEDDNIDYYARRGRSLSPGGRRPEPYWDEPRSSSRSTQSRMAQSQSSRHQLPTPSYLEDEDEGFVGDESMDEPPPPIRRRSQNRGRSRSRIGTRFSDDEEEELRRATKHNARYSSTMGRSGRRSSRFDDEGVDLEYDNPRLIRPTRDRRMPAPRELSDEDIANYERSVGSFDTDGYRPRPRRPIRNRRRSGRLAPPSSSSSADSLLDSAVTRNGRPQRRNAPPPPLSDEVEDYSAEVDDDDEPLTATEIRRSALTKGTSLPHDPDGLYPTVDTAVSSWDKKNRVSASTAQEHAEKRSGPRYVPTIEESYPTVYSGIRPALRKTDPSAEDLSCYPLPDYKLDPDFRVGWDKLPENYWKRHAVPFGEEEINANWAPSILPTIDTVMTRQAGKMLKAAGVTAAPTTKFTMESDFPTMYRLGLSGLEGESIAPAFSTLSGTEKTTLRGELAEFKKLGLIRRKHLGDAGYGMIQSRANLDFWATDKYQKANAAGEVLAMWVDNVTGICDTVEERRKWLDNGTDIDDDPRASQMTNLSSADKVANRDYSTDEFMPNVPLTWEKTEDKRDAICEAYDPMYSQIESELVEAGGEAPKPVLSAWSTQVDTWKALWDNYKKDGREKGVKRGLKTIAKDNFLTLDEYKSKYPLMSEYPTWSSVVAASEETDNPHLLQDWRRMKEKLRKTGIRAAYANNPVELTGDLKTDVGIMQLQMEVSQAEEKQKEQRRQYEEKKREKKAKAAAAAKKKKAEEAAAASESESQSSSEGSSGSASAKSEEEADDSGYESG